MIAIVGQEWRRFPRSAQAEAWAQARAQELDGTGGLHGWSVLTEREAALVLDDNGSPKYPRDTPAPAGRIGRPRSGPEALTHTVAGSVTESEAARVDEARGAQSRSAWVREALLMRLVEGT